MTTNMRVIPLFINGKTMQDSVLQPALKLYGHNVWGFYLPILIMSLFLPTLVIA